MFLINIKFTLFLQNLEEITPFIENDLYKSENMEKFESEINKLNEDVEFTTWLSAEEDARKVNNTLIVNAKDEGKQENQIKAAKNLLSKGMKIEEVIDALNVEDEDTKKEIKK